MLYWNIQRDKLMNNLKTSRTVLAITIAAMLMFSGTTAFAEIGTGPANQSPGFGTSSLTLDDNGSGATFSGNGGYSADGIGMNPSTSGMLSADIPAGSTVVDAFLYATTVFDPSIASVTVELDDTSYTLSPMPFNTYDGCCALLSFKYSGADLVAQVAAKYVSDGPGVIDFIAEEISPGVSATDGVALVVIFSNPAEPFRTIAIMDGSLATLGEETLIGLAEPLDKTVPGFVATLALGIGFSAQDFSGAGSNQCGTDDNQGSTVDINGARLTSCAGNFDDSIDTVANGNLFTVGGIGDVVDNPDDPLQFAADGDLPRTTDDELYDLEPLLAQGITLIDMDTANASEDDLIFLSILSITAQASVGEICGDGIDNDEDGSIDEGCQVDDGIVGGEFLPIDATALVVAGAQANAIWILSALAVIGSVAFGTLYLKTRKD
jgi:hypothetical protein